MKTRVNPIFVAAVFVILAFCISPKPAHAKTTQSKTTREAAAEIAKQIATTPLVHQHGSIRLGAFTGPSTEPPGGGAGLRHEVKQKLEELKITVKTLADKYGVKAEYRTQTDGSVLITGKVLDKDGKLLRELNSHIDHPDDVSVIRGLTSPVDPASSRSAMIKKMKLQQPNLKIQNAVVATSETSPFNVEFHVDSDGDGQYEPRSIQNVEDFAFIELNRGDRFAFRIVNSASYDAGVGITLDGISIFEFSEEGRYPYLLVRGRQTSPLIKGWYITNKRADRFVVSEYGESVAKQLGRPEEGTGALTFRFHAAWSDSRKPPPGEILLANRGDAIKRGGPVDQAMTVEKRFFGELRDVITVRYQRDK